MNNNGSFKLSVILSIISLAFFVILFTIQISFDFKSTITFMGVVASAIGLGFCTNNMI